MANMSLRAVLCILALGINVAVAFVPASGRGLVRSRAMMMSDMYGSTRAASVRDQRLANRVSLVPVPA